MASALAVLDDQDTQFSDFEIVDAEGPVDLTSLPAEKRQKLETCLVEFKAAGRRLISELFVMTEQLAEMREILGRRMYPYVRQELNLGKRTLTRYLHINKVLRQHFVVDGKLIGELPITQRALALLSPETDESVIDEVKAAFEQGGQVDENFVRDLLTKLEAEHATRLASAQAELQASTKAMQRAQATHEVELARAQRELATQGELLRRAQSTSELLEQENEKLRKDATQVRFEEKKVEIVPPGYQSAQEAIEAKQGELAELSSQEQAAIGKIQALEQERVALEEKIAKMNAGVVDFLNMKEQVESLIVRFPVALLKDLAANDPAAKTAVATLGQTMKLFGEQLNSAA